MRPHTEEQVLAMKQFADTQPGAAERKAYKLSNLEVVYTTIHLSGDLKPFDYAVMAFVTKRDYSRFITEDDYEIAVSDDVPEELQGLWAWHELHDFGVLGHEAENRCLDSEQEILESLIDDPELLKNYLMYRIPFYDNLAIYIARDLDKNDNKSIYSPSDLQGCYDAIAFLEEQRIKAENGVALRSEDHKHDQAIVPDSYTQTTLLDAAKAKIAEIKQRENKKTIQDRAERSIEVKLKLESDSNVEQFIKLMRTARIRPQKVYRQDSTLVHMFDHGSDYDGGRDRSYTYDLKTIYVGEGWLTTDDQQTHRYILLTDGKAYHAVDLVRVGEEQPYSNTTYRNINGVTPVDGAIRMGPIVKSPFAGDGAKILIDTLLRSGAVK